MKWIKCKNDTEKVQAIKKYCEEQIKENNFSINSYKADRTSSFDYAYEIHELEMRNTRFENILKIIEADELTSVLVL